MSTARASRATRDRVHADLEPIDPSKTYPLPALAKCGFKPQALATARKRGLPVRYVGRHGFVDGQDLIDHIREHGKLDHAEVTTGKA